MTEHETDNDSFAVESKTQLKKKMLALQELGKNLTKLPADKLNTIPLNDTLREAIEQAHQIYKRGAIKRHMQYIGRLMRESDYDAIIEAYEKIQADQQRHARQHHLVEKWRTDLIQGEDDLIQQFIISFPDCDRQQLRQLVRNAKKEAMEKKPLINSRKLFKFVRDTLN